MFTLFFGFLTTVLLTAIVVMFTMRHPSELIDWMAFMLVFGGTATIALFSVPLKNLKETIKAVLSLTKTRSSRMEYMQDLIALSSARDNKDKVSTPTNHPLMALAKYQWSVGIEGPEFEGLLSAKRDELDYFEHMSPQAIQNLADYPPSLGLVGTVIALSDVLLSMNELNGDLSKIGRPIGLGLIGTFFGLFLSQMVLKPLADRLTLVKTENVEINELVFNYLIEINRKSASLAIKNSLMGGKNGKDQ